MTRREFMLWLKRYYCTPPVGQQEELHAYLGEFSPAYLDALREAVKRSFSSRFGKCPDIAVLEECKGGAHEIMRARIEASAPALLEEPIQRGEGELMRIDWDQVFRGALDKSRQYSRWVGGG